MTISAKPRLLVIDDEAAVCAMVASIASQCGYEVRTSSDASDVDGHLETWQPTQIVLDLQMPGTDGIEILRRLAEKRCLADIVIMSGFDEKVLESAQHLGRERGLNIVSTIQKPFRAEELESVLNVLQPMADAIDAGAISAAIERSQFVLVFQPKVDLRRRVSGTRTQYETVGFEALIRWKHPRRGLLAPMEFLPLAESLGLMNHITDIVIELALRQQRFWLDRGIRMSLALNVSAQNLRETAFADRLERRCRDVNVPPELLIVELTETAAMEDVTVAMDILTRLRIKGFQLSIDDFGTGYSSLVQLQLLPFSELKIDRAFVRECDSSRQSRIIVKTMIDLARNLGLVSVAEGVESAAILNAVRDNGCDLAQGYFISKPLSSEETILWITGEA